MDDICFKVIDKNFAYYTCHPKKLLESQSDTQKIGYSFLVIDRNTDKIVKARYSLEDIFDEYCNIETRIIK